VPVARIDINRIDIAVVVSLLLHGAIAMIPVTKREGEIGALVAPQPFVARIVEAKAEVAPPAPEPVREPVIKPVAQPRPSPPPPPQVASVAPPPIAMPVERAPEVLQRPAPQFDMMAAINARRERRRDYEHELLRQAEARDSPSRGSGDPALSSIERNLKSLNAGQEGAGGVFTILSKGTRTAEFAFNGWRPDTQRRWREVIEVDAGQGGDVELAIVRRMIELIRGHYTGDFVWKSNRLGRNIVMSARPEDQAGLESFLLREFFDSSTLAQKRH
jgi:hypothetical protein